MNCTKAHQHLSFDEGPAAGLLNWVLSVSARQEKPATLRTGPPEETTVDLRRSTGEERQLQR